MVGGPFWWVFWVWQLALGTLDPDRDPARWPDAQGPALGDRWLGC